ncbi:hypothetical protein MOUN0_E06040 [Monosporozyma unispora]
MFQNISNSALNVKHLANSGFSSWGENDYRPPFDRILLSLTQIGCADIVVITAFQFMNFVPLHVQVTKLLSLIECSFPSRYFSFFVFSFVLLPQCIKLILPWPLVMVWSWSSGCLHGYSCGQLVVLIKIW